jgi:hypothetical protein
MHDSSVIHNNKDNIREAIELLEDDILISAVSLPVQVRSWTKLDQNHIKNGCIISRGEVWKDMVFKIEDGMVCTCTSFQSHARRFGIYRFLDLDETRVKINKRK